MRGQVGPNLRGWSSLSILLAVALLAQPVTGQEDGNAKEEEQPYWSITIKRLTGDTKTIKCQRVEPPQHIQTFRFVRVVDGEEQPSPGYPESCILRMETYSFRCVQQALAHIKAKDATGAQDWLDRAQDFLDREQEQIDMLEERSPGIRRKIHKADNKLMAQCLSQIHFARIQAGESHLTPREAFDQYAAFYRRYSQLLPKSDIVAAARSRLATYASKVIRNLYDKKDWDNLRATADEILDVLPKERTTCDILRQLKERTLLEIRQGLQLWRQAQSKRSRREKDALRKEAICSHWYRAQERWPDLVIKQLREVGVANPSEPGVANLNLHDGISLARLVTNAEAVFQVLRYGELTFPSTLNPLLSTTLCEKRLCRFLFNSLMVHRSQTDIVRDLAAYYSQPASLSYDFKLKKNIFWSRSEEDSAPRRLTALDVEWTIRLLSQPIRPTYNPILGSYIKKVEIHPNDGLALTVYVKRSTPVPKELFTFPIVPRHILRTADGRMRGRLKSIPGAGPFCIQKQDDIDDVNYEIRLVPNESFARRYPTTDETLPKMSEVILKTFGDQRSLVNHLERNQIDLAPEVGPEEVKRLKTTGGFHVHSYLASSVYMIGLKYAKHGFHPTERERLIAQKSFRQALIYALDRMKVLESVYHGGRGGLAHKLLSGPFPKNVWASNHDIKPRAQDLSLARTLMDDACKAAHVDPAAIGELRFVFPPGDIRIEQVCVEFKKQWAALGLNVVLDRAKTADDFATRARDRRFDLLYYRYDFENGLYDVAPLFRTRTYRRRKDGTKVVETGGRNFWGYSSRVLDKTFEQLRVTDNPVSIRTLSREVHRIVHEDAAIIPLWQLDRYAAFSERIQGYVIHPYYLFGRPEQWSIRPEWAVTAGE